MDRGLLLHVGCGGESLPDFMSGFVETRLDIDASQRPDIVASMLDMGDIGEYDCIYCNHALEHLYPFEVKIAIKEFKRCLKPGGYIMVFVPDLEGVQATEKVLFESPSGPISGLDMIYGYARALREGNLFMAHKCGFVADTLKTTFEDVGFSKVKSKRIGNYNLMVVAVK
jgi:SAM-dependent methyltransferase